MSRFFVFLFILFLPTSLSASLPDPAPPFQVSAIKRQDPVLKIGTVTSHDKIYTQPSFWLGNKRIGFRDSGYLSGNFHPETESNAKIIVDGRELFRFVFFGSHAGSGMGYPFEVKAGTTPDVTADEATKTITYSRDYLLPDGDTATFHFTLKGLGDSKVEMGWDLGISEEKLASLPADFNGVNLWIASTNVYRNEAIQINDHPLKLAETDKLTTKSTNLDQGEGLKFEYAPDKPLESFSFELPDDYTYVAMERATSDSASPNTELCIQTNRKHRATQGSMVIDFGESAVGDAAAPPPVADIDFWGRDATCVPASTTRNLMPNPSFEQGLRYWRWWYGGSPRYAGTVPKYDIANDAKFGGKSLLINPGGGQQLQSFPIPVKKDQPYTVSFYVKSAQPGNIGFGVYSPLKGSKMDWRAASTMMHPVTKDWVRQSFTFTPDQSAICFLVNSNGSVLVDGIQLEEGTRATDFVAPQVEGVLRTSDADNMLAKGAPLQAAFDLQGTPGLSGKIQLKLIDFYRQTVSSKSFPFQLDKTGAAHLALPWQSDKIGTGVFVVRADYTIGGVPAGKDYDRFSIMDFLDNTHATKDMFGTLDGANRTTRPDDAARDLMRWGFGSTTYGEQKKEEFDQLQKYHIDNFLMILKDTGTPEQVDFISKQIDTWTEITPEREQQVEDLAYDIVSKHPWGRSWALGTEQEGKVALIRAGKFDEWLKVQQAVQRGVRKARPDAWVLADGGTSGFSRLRGIRETEGYLAASEGKVKWDAVATHPYGNLDGVHGSNDLDVETARMLDLMKQHGYGADTPLDYTEGFNLNDMILPEWGLTYDSDDYDTYGGGRPTYDFGWREYLQACWAARTWLISLKYWPQVRSFNVWISHPYIDLHLTPLAVCKIPNTIGHLLGNPKFLADVQPAAGVRGYVFEDDKGRGVAAIWCAMDKVEQGLERGPEMRVKFSGKVPDFVDLMGNTRPVTATDGNVSIQLTSAPLFLRSEEGGANALAADLNAGEVEGAGSALKIAVQPTVSGALEADVANLTNRPKKGTLDVDGTAVPFDLAGKATATYPLPGKSGADTGKLYDWNKSIGVAFADGRKDTVDYKLAWFNVPHAAAPLPEDPAAPEWKAIPAIALTNRFAQNKAGEPPVQIGYPGDLDARYQMAWDKDNLYLRIEAKDDKFVVSDPARWSDKTLYAHDGAAEVYFDTGANGRSNAVRGFDDDDYRYDFSPDMNAANGPAAAYRFVEPFRQLAGGLDMPTKEEAAAGVKTQFRRTDEGYAYVLIFPQRFIEPLHLEKGWRAGFGLFLHDNDGDPNKFPPKGLSNSTEPGTPCDRRPDLWPEMVLGE
jgi:hypothetical protein